MKKQLFRHTYKGCTTHKLPASNNYKFIAVILHLLFVSARAAFEQYKFSILENLLFCVRVSDVCVCVCRIQQKRIASCNMPCKIAA